MTACSQDPSDPRRGAALFVVLMICASLAALAAAAMRTGVSGARAAQVFADAARADALGEAAGDVLTYQLLTGNAESHRGGSLGVRLPEAQLDIDYVSESARIDVNTAPPGLISALLSVAGADTSLVESVVARIQAAREAAKTAQAGSKPQAPETVPAMSAPLPVPPSAAPPLFSNPMEVVGAWGLPKDLASRVLPALTVANGSKGVDPILADRLVLSALLNGDETRIDDYIERRSQGFVNADSALALLPVPSRGFVDFDDVAAVRAVAHVTVARRFERRYELVVAPSSGPAKTPVVIGWRKLL